MKEQQEYPIRVKKEFVIERLTLKKLFHDIFAAFNLEHGILHAVVALVKDPGDSIRTFLYQGRHSFFHPVRLLIITTALGLLTFYIADTMGAFQGSFTVSEVEGADTKEAQEKAEATFKLFMQIISNYYNILTFLLVPITALFSYWFFKKSGYNYAESLVLNAYAISIANLFNFFFSVFLLLAEIQLISILQTVAYIGYVVYSYISFYREKTFKGVVKSLVALFLATILYFIIAAMLVTPIVVYQAKSAGIV